MYATVDYDIPEDGIIRLAFFAPKGITHTHTNTHTHTHTHIHTHTHTHKTKKHSHALRNGVLHPHIWCYGRKMT